MTAEELWTAISVAPAGSTAQTHALSARDRLSVMGLNLTANIKNLTAQDSSNLATLDLETTISVNNSLTLQATIETLTATTC